MKFRRSFGWIVYIRYSVGDTSQLHVVPLNDDKEHRLSPRCSCTPFLDDDGDGGAFWVHNSFDGRHEYENNGRLRH